MGKHSKEQPLGGAEPYSSEKLSEVGLTIYQTSINEAMFFSLNKYILNTFTHTN